MYTQKQRRAFFRKGLGALALLGFSGFAAKKQLPTLGGNFVHSVYFWMKNPEDENSKSMFLSNLKVFLEKVDVINSYYIGTPAQTPREVVDNSYTFSLIVTFNDKAAHDIYQSHEAHLKFINETSTLWARVQIYDALAVF